MGEKGLIWVDASAEAELGSVETEVVPIDLAQIVADWMFPVEGNPTSPLRDVRGTDGWIFLVPSGPVGAMGMSTRRDPSIFNGWEVYPVPERPIGKS